MPRYRWEICDRCDGEGQHVHEALSVWTQDDIAEDPDSFEAMRAGCYDVRCEECGGTGKVKVHESDHEYDPKCSRGRDDDDEGMCDACYAVWDARERASERATIRMEMGGY